MKAIHNASEGKKNTTQTVFNTSKIQNESNSQLTGAKHSEYTDCVQYVKDTK